MARSYTVSEVARLSHVTVRTLHHYDEIGLLTPLRRGKNGYRQYTPEDLRRLQRIVVLRELGFSLGAIEALVMGDAHELRSALEQQRVRLARDLERAKSVLAAVEALLENANTRQEDTVERLFDGNALFDHLEHEAETRERWGDTDAYRESARRTRTYGKEDWERIKAEAAAIVSDFAALQRAGVSPTSAEARALAELHRLHIDRWYYPCEHAQHCRLAELYVMDSRFAEAFDRHAAGLSGFVAGAIHANRAEDGGANL